MLRAERMQRWTGISRPHDREIVASEKGDVAEKREERLSESLRRENRSGGDEERESVHVLESEKGGGTAIGV